MPKKTAKFRGCSPELLPSGKYRLRWRYNRKRFSVTLDEPDTAEGREKVQRLANVVVACLRDRRDPQSLFDKFDAGSPSKIGLSFEDHLRVWQRRRSPFTEDGKLIKDAPIRPTTWIHDESNIKRLIAGMGHLDVYKLKRTDFDEFAYQLKQEKRPNGEPLLSGTTIAKITALAHAALQPLAEDGIIPKNPAPKTTAVVPDSIDRRPLEPETIAKFINTLPAGLALDDGAIITGSMLRAHYELWSRTGMRSNELGGLQYGDLDFTHQVIHVRRGRSPRSYGKEDGLVARPKNKRGRDLDCQFDPEIFKILERLKKDSLAAGRPTWVFYDSLGRPISQEMLHKRCWRPGLRLLGLAEEDERQGSYIMRHSFITAALSAGEDPGWVALFVGHTEQVLWSRYRKYIKTNKGTPGAALAARMRQATHQMAHERPTKATR